MSSTQALSLTQNSSLMAKVLGYFGLALALTGAGLFLALLLAPVLIASPLLFFGILAAELIMVFTARRWSAIPVWGVVIFGAFAVLSGMSLLPIVASVAAEFNITMVLSVLFTTTLVFFAAALIGATTKYSLANLYGVAFMGLLALLTVNVIGVFIPWGNGFEMFVSGAGATLFALYAAIDVNRMRDISENSHSLAIQLAINLYLDFFNLFIYLLRLVSASSRN